MHNRNRITETDCLYKLKFVYSLRYIWTYVDKYREFEDRSVLKVFCEVKSFNIIILIDEVGRSRLIYVESAEIPKPYYVTEIEVTGGIVGRIKRLGGGALRAVARRKFSRFVDFTVISQYYSL